ncbi:MAG: hypothetical protein AAB544_01680 [Patescibacteria group bacterium]
MPIEFPQSADEVIALFRDQPELLECAIGDVHTVTDGISFHIQQSHACGGVPVIGLIMPSVLDELDEYRLRMFAKLYEEGGDCTQTLLNIAHESSQFLLNIHDVIKNIHLSDAARETARDAARTRFCYYSLYVQILSIYHELFDEELPTAVKSGFEL